MADLIVVYAGRLPLLSENIRSIHNLCRLQTTQIVLCPWSNNVEQFQMKGIGSSIHVNQIAPREELYPEYIPAFYRHILYQYDALDQAFNYALRNTCFDHYTMFMRSRTDLYIEKPVSINMAKNNAIAVSRAKYGIGLNDYFALGSQSPMVSYFSHFETLVQLGSLGFYLPPEISLRMHLDKLNTGYYIDQTLPVQLIESKNGFLRLRTKYESETSTALFTYHGYNIACQDMDRPSQVGFIWRKLVAIIRSVLLGRIDGDRSS